MNAQYLQICRSTNNDTTDHMTSMRQFTQKQIFWPKPMWLTFYSWVQTKKKKFWSKWLPNDYQNTITRRHVSHLWRNHDLLFSVNAQPQQKNRNYGFWDACWVCPTRVCAALPTAGVSQRPQHPELVPGQTYWSLGSHMGRHTWVWSHGLIPLPSDTHLPAARLPQLGTAHTHTHTRYHRSLWGGLRLFIPTETLLKTRVRNPTNQRESTVKWTEQQHDGKLSNSPMT